MDRTVSSTDPAIRLSGLTFAYEEREAVLSDLDFALHAGQKVGLIGANGSGKTTLLHLIVGLLLPTSGQVEVFGRVCRHEADFQEARARVGLLFQDAEDQLFCPSVAEDVAFGPLNLGKSREEVAEIVRATLDRLGLQGFEERITHHLSGGEKRLVSLAGVLAMSPDVLLLDEPTSGLDEATVDHLVQVLQQEIRTCIIVTHDHHFLERITGDVYVVEDGRISPGQ